MKLSIIVPVYNEVGTVAKLLEEVDEVPLMKEIVVVDDGSTDGTRDVLKSFEGRAGFQVIYHAKNGGKGRAIRSGLEKVSGEVTVIQDADLEYDPMDFIPMVQLFKDGKARAVFGSRRLRKENKQYAGPIYYAGGVFLSCVTNILYGTRITDEPTCYKMVETQLLRDMKLTSEHFEFCPEVTAKLALRKIPIVEIPIKYMPRHKDEGKKIGWRDAVEATWVLLKLRFGGH